MYKVDSPSARSRWTINAARAIRQNDTQRPATFILPRTFDLSAFHTMAISCAVSLLQDARLSTVRVVLERVLQTDLGNPSTRRVRRPRMGGKSVIGGTQTNLASGHSRP